MRMPYTMRITYAPHRKHVIYALAIASLTIAL